MAGTSAGAKKAWLTRKRGGHQVSADRKVENRGASRKGRGSSIAFGTYRDQMTRSQRRSDSSALAAAGGRGQYHAKAKRGAVLIGYRGRNEKGKLELVKSTHASRKRELTKTRLFIASKRPTGYKRVKGKKQPKPNLW